ncbi:hypothetical protein BTI62_02280 [Lactobacillus delbrueckii subsp. bulgaricus]|nr:hypothetical protein [Lactobacillus delbrueckii subsp. bulgaricus]MBT8922483.1 hypothetical protein [Lactobacillus delbrueckii subsp. bulgaricus]
MITQNQFFDLYLERPDNTVYSSFSQMSDIQIRNRRLMSMNALMSSIRAAFRKVKKEQVSLIIA